jgi:hypothetical protein
MSPVSRLEAMLLGSGRNTSSLSPTSPRRLQHRPPLRPAGPAASASCRLGHETTVDMEGRLAALQGVAQLDAGNQEIRSGIGWRERGARRAKPRVYDPEPPRKR